MHGHWGCRETAQMNKHHKDEDGFYTNHVQGDTVQKGALNIHFPAEIMITSDQDS